MYVFDAYMKTRDCFRETYQGLDDKTYTFFYKLLLCQLPYDIYFPSFSFFVISFTSIEKSKIRETREIIYI